VNASAALAGTIAPSGAAHVYYLFPVRSLRVTAAVTEFKKGRVLA